QVVQGLAVHVLHHHEFGIAFGDGVVNGVGTGVIQAGRGLGFLQEAAAALGVAGFRGGQHLEGYRAIQPGIQGFIDFPHASRAQFLEQLILLKRSPYHTAASGTLPVWHSWKAVGRGTPMPWPTVSTAGPPWALTISEVRRIHLRHTVIRESYGAGQRTRARNLALVDQSLVIDN